MLAQVSREAGVVLDCLVGTMIELPRAALTAGRIAEEAEFFSFGTNDLTQTTWGFSRDDVEAEFFSAYLDKGVFSTSPFEAIDREGVGRLVGIAVAEGRATRPDLKIGGAVSTAATPNRCTSSTPPDWATSPARRSGCRWHDWRRGGPPWRRPRGTTAGEPRERGRSALMPGTGRSSLRGRSPL